MSHPQTRLPAVAQRHRAAFCSAGCWQLKRGHALGLHPACAAELHLVRGKLWITLGASGDARGLGDQAGDIFLSAGQSLTVPAGARLVMESLDPIDAPDVLFDWSDAPAAGSEQQSSRFQRDVAAPAADLLWAVKGALRALVRLIRGVLGYGEFAVAGRGRVLAPLEGNPP